MLMNENFGLKSHEGGALGFGGETGLAGVQALSLSEINEDVNNMTTQSQSSRMLDITAISSRRGLKEQRSRE